MNWVRFSRLMRRTWKSNLISETSRSLFHLSQRYDTTLDHCSHMFSPDGHIAQLGFSLSKIDGENGANLLFTQGKQTGKKKENRRKYAKEAWSGFKKAFFEEAVFFRFPFPAIGKLFLQPFVRNGFLFFLKILVGHFLEGHLVSDEGFGRWKCYFHQITKCHI